MSEKTLKAIAKREEKLPGRVADRKATKVTVTVTGKPLTDKIIDPDAPA